MAAFHGKKGKATFTSLTFELTSFTVDVTCDTAASTAMSSVSVTSALVCGCDCCLLNGFSGLNLFDI